MRVWWDRGWGKVKPKAGLGSELRAQWGAGERSEVKVGTILGCVYSQHGHVEGVGDVRGGGQMPGAVEAFGVGVGAAAEHRLPWRH